MWNKDPPSWMEAWRLFTRTASTPFLPWPKAEKPCQQWPCQMSTLFICRGTHFRILLHGKWFLCRPKNICILFSLATIAKYIHTVYNKHLLTKVCYVWEGLWKEGKRKKREGKPRGRRTSEASQGIQWLRVQLAVQVPALVKELRVHTSWSN